jgi:hypothetical protein
MTATKVSLGQQIEEIDYELAQRRIVYARIKDRAGPGSLKARECDYHMARLRAVRDTLAWMQRHEAELRAAARGD